MSPTRFDLGLVGYPVDHSLSPPLHKAALKEFGFDGDYRLYPVAPNEAGMESLQSLLKGLRLGKLQGLNVTIPHKQTVLPYMDRLTPVAQQIKAVNTIYCKDGMLVGDNTDGAGFWVDLCKKLPFSDDKDTQPVTDGEAERLPLEALLLGAGGSARAIVFALWQAGWNISIASRRLQQARTLAADYAPHKGRISTLELNHLSLGNLLAGKAISLIVNTTPLGMHSFSPDSPWPAGLDFPPQAFVYDLVYHPAETMLIQQARSAGLRASNGLGMLVEQAVASFELWTGVRPSTENLFAALGGSA